MPVSRLIPLTLLSLAAGAILLSSCAANEPAATEPAADGSEAPTTSLSGDLAGAGASSMGAAQEAWIAGFQGENEAVNVTLGARRAECVPGRRSAHM